ncbi:hypothetical protein DKG74_03735 [Zavarzinia aquatilis]|uniref:ABC transporter substrate-binding protein n=1 Tax=Zavarzinia aquatilis TaxID=2211142 RepID=A0A317EF28_9PROT|nr:hypothetical protein DKG74_03735 [Zavarzinia aquatilis]
MHLLAPAAYDDPGVLSALKTATKSAFDLQPLANDDSAVAPLVPLLPGATAAQRAARPTLTVAAHPWLRGILWPEGAVDPLGKDGSAPASSFELAPGLSPPLAELESGLEGSYLLGRTLRFDIAGVGVDSRRVSVAALDDIGLSLIDDPALSGRYGLVHDARCLLPLVMLYCGLDPFRLQLDSELRRFEAGMRRLVERAALIAATPAEAAAALADGRIDLALPLGLGAMAPARLAGGRHLTVAAPGRGPMAGQAAFYWVEMLALPTQCPKPDAARAVLDAVAGRPLVSALARMGGLCPAAGLLAAGNVDILTAEERLALDFEAWPALLARCTAMDLVPERKRLQPLLDAALAARK